MKITLTLPRPDYDALQALAQSQRRPVKDQALWMIEQSLRRAQRPVTPTTDPTPEPLLAA